MNNFKSIAQLEKEIKEFETTSWEPQHLFEMKAQLNQTLKIIKLIEYFGTLYNDGLTFVNKVELIKKLKGEK